MQLDVAILHVRNPKLQHPRLSDHSLGLMDSDAARAVLASRSREGMNTSQPSCARILLHDAGTVTEQI